MHCHVKANVNYLQLILSYSRFFTMLIIPKMIRHCTKNEVSKACNFIKKETLAQVFSREFCEISKNIFFFTEHLRWLLLAVRVASSEKLNQELSLRRWSRKLFYRTIKEHSSHYLFSQNIHPRPQRIFLL